MRLYIDPGTGSMLFTILIGVLGAGVYFLRNAFMKLRFLMSGGSREKQSADRIPIVIFSDSKRYWTVFEPVCDELERRGQDAVYMTASPDDPALQKEYAHIRCEFIGEGNKAFARLNLLKADVVLSTTPGLDVYQWKRSRDVKRYIHIPHAPSDITLYRMFGIDYYAAVLLSGEYQLRQIRKLEELRSLPAKDLAIVGIPYMDEMKKRLDSAEPLPERPVTVLLAPSWGPSAIFSRFGGQVIEALLQTGYHVVVRPHPQSFTSEKEMLDDLMARFPASEQLEWNRDNDNFEVLRRSDILISDFSGVLFEFSLVFDKPLIYTDTTFDKAPYDAAWLEDELWTFRILPQIGQKLTSESLGNVESLIDTCLQDPRYQAARQKAREETWQHIGEGAVRTADYLIKALKTVSTAEIDVESKDGRSVR